MTTDRDAVTRYSFLEPHRKAREGTAGSASSGLIVSRGDFDVIFRLTPDFRFVHEPLGTPVGASAGGAKRFVGRRRELAELGMRLLFSSGGAFLVTGYRGIGKTSFVNQAVSEVSRWAKRIEPTVGSAISVVDVRLNLARVMGPVEIMHHIIRGLYRRLEELHLLQRIRSDLRAALELAFQRTSFHISRSSTQASEAGIEIGGLGWQAVSSGLRTRSSRSRTSQLEFLSYDDKSAEYDIMRLSRLLSEGFTIPWWKLAGMRIAGTRPYRQTLLKIIFIFDELDKLDSYAAEGEPSPVDSMIGLLKNVFTTSGICFVFIAGRELEDRWRADLGRGDSLYESVFSYNKYLPPMWDDVGEICDGLVHGGRRPEPLAELPNKGVVVDAAEAYGEFKKYLAFIGRGIPRRILRSFHTYVHWDGQNPYVGFTREDRRRHRFFSELQQLLSQQMPALVGENEQGPPARLDQFRLSIYYLIDWILAQRGATFALSDAVAATRRLSAKVALVEDVAGDVVQRLLNMLTEAHYLEKVTDDPDRVRLGSEDAETLYRLRRERLFQLGKERVVSDPAKLYAAESTVTVQVGEFELRSKLAEGGMSEIWLAWDTRADREVVLKLLLPSLADDAELRTRFSREGELLLQLQRPGHPNIVRVYQHGEQAQRPYIVMAHLQGSTLAELSRSGPLPEPIAAAIVRYAASAYDYVHGHGMVRLDVKPANIMIETNGSVIVYDFGIARPKGEHEDELTKTGVLIGTPKYMAPEQVLGTPVDERADVFSLGLVLYELLAGEYPFPRDEGAVKVLYAIAHEEPPSLQAAGVSAELESVALKCLAKDARDRYQSMAELRDALPSEDRPEERIAAFVQRAGAERSASRSEVRTDIVLRPPTVIAEPPGAPASLPPAESARQPPPPAATTPAAEDSTGAVLRPPAAVPAAASAAATLRGPALRILNGARAGSTLPLKDGMTIGRSREADLVLDDRGVSRFHARVSFVYPTMRVGDTVTLSRRIELEDLGSSSGTYLNGEQVSQAATLESGDQLKIGGTKFEVLLAG